MRMPILEDGSKKVYSIVITDYRSDPTTSAYLFDTYSAAARYLTEKGYIFHRGEYLDDDGVLVCDTWKRPDMNCGHRLYIVENPLLSNEDIMRYETKIRQWRRLCFWWKG